MQEPIYMKRTCVYKKMHELWVFDHFHHSSFIQKPPHQGVSSVHHRAYTHKNRFCVYKKRPTKEAHKRTLLNINIYIYLYDECVYQGVRSIHHRAYTHKNKFLYAKRDLQDLQKKPTTEPSNIYMYMYDEYVH